jgi:hypothetical protein
MEAGLQSEWILPKERSEHGRQEGERAELRKVACTHQVEMLNQGGRDQRTGITHNRCDSITKRQVTMLRKNDLKMHTSK